MSGPAASRFAHAVSEHPLATQATGEVAGQLLDAIGAEPDLLVVFASPDHVGAFEDVAASLRSLLAPRAMLGATAVSVVAGPRELEDGPALAAFAARCGPVVPLRLTVHQRDEGLAFAGMPADLDDGTLIVLTDPFSFPAEAFLQVLGAERPELTVIGGVASAARGPGGNRLVLDGSVEPHGAVAVWLPAGVRVSTVVSQGCRPIGEPFIVTRSEGRLIHDLGGRRALLRLQELVGALPEEERALLTFGLHLGVVIDESRLEFGRGDFLVRNVVEIDQESGAIGLGVGVPVGSTVQFQVRDALTADEDLRQLMEGRRAAGGLLFTCNGRGRHLFATPDHDASVVSESIGGRPLAGMFCAGEVGPVGGRSFLHGFTASVVLFDEAVRAR